jgi:hypothetical protein
VLGVVVVLLSYKLSVLWAPLPQETMGRIQRISIPGQGEHVVGNQKGAESVTFDLSMPLLKRLITGSQSLYRQVQRDANWASQCQLSVNNQSLVIKKGS